MNREAVAWAAGIFEGEGWLGFHGRGRDGVGYARRQGLGAAVAMTDRDVVERFAAVLPFPVTAQLRSAGHVRRDGGPRKPVWAVQVYGFERVQVMVAMFWPWLGTRRREQARTSLRDAAAVRAEQERKPYSRRILKGWDTRRRAAREASETTHTTLLER